MEIELIGVLKEIINYEYNGKLIKKIFISPQSEKYQSEFMIEIWDSSLKFFQDACDKKGIKTGSYVKVNCFLRGSRKEDKSGKPICYHSLGYKSIDNASHEFKNSYTSNQDLF